MVLESVKSGFELFFQPPAKTIAGLKSPLTSRPESEQRINTRGGGDVASLLVYTRFVPRIGMKPIEGRVLVVDDDPQIRRVMRTTLEAKGHEVIEAGSGEQALELAGSEKLELILLDFNLPGRTGVETCREIRSVSTAPVIMLTVRDASQDKIEALDAGACDYITKPFAMGELLARIRAVLRRTPSPVLPGIIRLKLDDAEINFESRRVIVAGSPIRLTSKEFDLLLYLATHRNRTVPHRELLREVWGAEHVNERKYLRVFVNRLRKKIEAHPDDPKFLLTEPFVGYRLQTPESAG
jgi:two-component system, OmpR family, KDP operon response regulator KdpE